MAATFEEFLKQQQSQLQTAISDVPAGSFQEFLNKGGQEAAITTPTQKPFLEREGIIQSILRPAINFGKDIAQFLPQFQEQKQKVEESQKYIADTLKKSDLSHRNKQIIANINDGQEPFKDIFQARTPEQILGDVAGTALLVATPASLLRGIGTGLVAQTIRGAVTGGTIGAAMGLSEGEKAGGVAKSTAIGAGLGAIAEPVIGLTGQALQKGIQKGIEKAKPFITNFFETESGKFISSVSARLKQFGDNGGKIVEGMLNADRNKLLRTGKFMNEADQAGMFSLNQEQRWSGKNSLLDRLEGRAVNEGDQIGQAFDVADKMRTEIGQEAQEKGVQVRYRGVKPFEAPPIAKIPKELQPLIEEARKYKSAEEFVKSYIPVYRGVERGVTDFRPSSGGRFSKSGSFSITTDPIVAKNYGEYGTTVSGFLDPKARIKILGKDIANTTTNLEAEIKRAKIQGYDGVKAQFMGTDEMIIINRDVLKTKSQLTDFYNQAVRGSEQLPQKIVKGGTIKPFQPRENYFPHIGATVNDIQDNSQIFKDAVQNAVRIGKFKSEEEAKRVAQSYADFVETNGRGGQFWVKWLVKDGQTSAGKLSEQEIRTLDAIERGVKPPKGLQYDQETITKLRNAMDEARGMTLRYFQKSRLSKFGQLEYAREVDFPFYDPDPARVLPKYVLGATGRLEQIESFGVKGEELNKLIGRIRRVQGSDAGREVADLVKTMTGTINASPKVEKTSMFLRALSVPKLAFSQIINIGQSVNSLLASDFPSFAKGFSAAFKEAGIQNALKSGSTLESVINEITTRAGESDFSRKFLKFTGFSATEKFNRIVSANVGMNWAAKNFSELLANPADKATIGRLTELGIDVPKALSTGKLTENELLKAAQIFTERTQFRARPLDLPKFASSPYGKLWFQFKSFAYNQTKFLKDEFKREIQSENYGRAVRNVLVISTIFPLTGEVLGDIKSLATGSKRPTPFLERYFDNLANAGGVGIAYDLLQSTANNKLAQTLLGPTLGSGVDIAQSVIQTIKKGEITDSQKKIMINQLGITRPLGNYVYSKDTKGYETFFETLKDFLNE